MIPRFRIAFTAAVFALFTGTLPGMAQSLQPAHKANPGPDCVTVAGQIATAAKGIVRPVQGLQPVPERKGAQRFDVHNLLLDAPMHPYPPDTVTAFNAAISANQMLVVITQVEIARINGARFVRATTYGPAAGGTGCRIWSVQVLPDNIRFVGPDIRLELANVLRRDDFE